MTLINVVVPLYREESLVEELHNRVTKALKKISTSYKIILVDDGSDDLTWQKISEIAKKDKKVQGVRLSRNFGHHYALTAGLHETDADWIVVMDGDLQDRPEVIPDLWNKAQEGYDVVFVSRMRRPEGLIYRAAQKLFYAGLRRLSGIKFDSTQANFSIVSRKVIDAYKSFGENARFYNSTITWLGFNRASVSAEHGTRHSGRPSYTLKKRFQLAGDIIFSFSERPLKFSIYLGLVMAALAFSYLFWVLIGAITWGFTVEGWSSVMAGIFLTGGIILVVLGITGIYIGRIFREVKNRPLYVIGERTGK
jgi:glycosyltransferase involved in cell wall biosynthesis